MLQAPDSSLKVDAPVNGQLMAQRPHAAGWVCPQNLQIQVGALELSAA